MAPRGGRALVVLACIVALASIAAPVALSSSSGPETTLSALATDVLTQLNRVRSDHGLAALRPNASLAAAAEQHSREMAADGYFDHTSADGTSFSSRLSRWYPIGSHSYWAVGENILWASPSVRSAAAVSMWMHSPEHRANILDARWREIGIGAVRATPGGTYGNRPVAIITTDFGVRR